jgi:transcriptional regulator with XRE-family HTH domain
MDTQANKDIMAKNIKRHMERKGVTKQQICDALGFKYTTFVDWINAKTYPRIGKVEAMANYFGCEKSDLIEEKLTTQGDELSDVEQEALSLFRRLSPELQKNFLDILSRIPVDEERN